MASTGSAGENGIERGGDGPNPGLYDGFEGYRTPAPEDYARALTQGVVVLDANVLLNLYRYTAEARDDLLAVLARLGERLWIPHQALAEFWRNRATVLRDPRDTRRAAEELNGLRANATRSVQTWANRVSLPADRLAELREAIEDGFATVVEAIDESADETAVSAARDTGQDAVLIALESIVQGRIGDPLDEEAFARAVVEGLRRVDMREPPGYMDKRKDDEGAAGDYIIWEQVLLEAARRGCDVVFVTGDVKEDWWREEAGERRGPRIELVEEMRSRAGKRLFMLRPTQLLNYAREALEVTVREESVQVADRVDRLLSEAQQPPPGGGWDARTIAELLERLAEEAPVQEAVIRLAASQDGYVTRQQVYEVGAYPDDRSLRGFSRPINRIAQAFREEGVVPEDAVDPLTTVYNQDSPSINLAAGFRIRPEVLPVARTAIAEQLSDQD
ncbi:MAG: PIN-like domain-containing protein [Gaiellaceae bacterium]